VCSVLELEDLAEDPRYKHNPGRLENHALLIERIGQACAKRDSRDVVEMIVNADVIGAPFNTPMTVLEDPHVQAEGQTLTLKIGDHDGRLPPLPIETNTFRFGVRHPAPKDAGIHTREVLSELSYTTDEIDAFARKGVISGPDLPAKKGGGSH
jgi:crotonobetainyl-CoA:carnitine CoA-transferase CaiB-like acyl-CoA transferase